MEALLNLPLNAWLLLSVGIGILWTGVTKKQLTYWGVLLFPFLWPVFVALWLFAAFASVTLLFLATITKYASILMFVNPIVVRVPAHKEEKDNDDSQ